ncbi:hypothetical protein OW763_00780 [Clostridium aestuarii]|uniref:DUF2680 domain-containing protein n=1 Tax=Clostridium aestuarii TaxID=338193 RepID=A0ABT4CYJ1_9CLOT|nr:hypothetical protein [Clostridium aestuarii]MCY6482888.1 hypothetical protein [Clostridium aestuarii]
MKKRKILATLTLVLTLGLGATAFAQNVIPTDNTPTSTTTTNSTTTKGIGLRRITGKRGYDYVVSIAKDILNIDDAAIDQARAENKTIYDLLEEKGISHDDFKAKLIESKEKAIDNAVEQGTITKEEGETYKENIKNNSANAVPGQGRLGAPRGNGQGLKDGTGSRNGGGKGRGTGNGLRDGSAGGQGSRGASNGYNCVLND